MRALRLRRTPVVIHLRVVVLELLPPAAGLRHLLHVKLLKPSAQALAVGVHGPRLGRVADVARVAARPVAAGRGAASGLKQSGLQSKPLNMWCTHCGVPSCCIPRRPVCGAASGITGLHHILPQRTWPPSYAQIMRNSPFRQSANFPQEQSDSNADGNEFGTLPRGSESHVFPQPEHVQSPSLNNPAPRENDNSS